MFWFLLFSKLWGKRMPQEAILCWTPGFAEVPQVALVVKNPLINAGNIRNISLIPRSGRSPGGGHGNSLQYSCLGNSLDRETWWATVHGVAKSHKGLGTHDFADFLAHFWCSWVYTCPSARGVVEMEGVWLSRPERSDLRSCLHLAHKCCDLLLPGSGQISV